MTSLNDNPFRTDAETDATISGAETVTAAVEAILADLRDAYRLDVAVDEIGFHVEQAVATYETGADTARYAARIEEIAAEETWELARELGLGFERSSSGDDEIRAEYLNDVVGSACTEISDLLLEHAHRVRSAAAPIADAA